MLTDKLLLLQRIITDNCLSSQVQHVQLLLKLNFSKRSFSLFFVWMLLFIPHQLHIHTLYVHLLDETIQRETTSGSA